MIRLVNLMHQEAGALLVGLIVVLGIWAFAELADEVREGETQAIDDRILQWFRNAENGQPIGPDWLIEVGLSFTALGSVAVLTLVIGLSAAYLWLRRKQHAMWLVIIATLGGQLLSSGLKWFFARPRPDQSLHLMEVSTASFPSGHSMLSAVVYLTLGAILAKVESKRRFKVYWITVAILISTLVGASRVYIGVHYPTDVLAGWAAGFSWALICWLLAQYLQRRGQLEGRAEDLSIAR